MVLFFLLFQVYSVRTRSRAVHIFNIFTGMIAAMDEYKKVCEFFCCCFLATWFWKWPEVDVSNKTFLTFFPPFQPDFTFSSQYSVIFALTRAYMLSITALPYSFRKIKRAFQKYGKPLKVLDFVTHEKKGKKCKIHGFSDFSGE